MSIQTGMEYKTGEIPGAVDGSLWLTAQQVLGDLTLTRSGLVTFRYAKYAESFSGHLENSHNASPTDTYEGRTFRVSGEGMTYGEPADQSEVDATISDIRDWQNDHNSKGLLVIDETSAPHYGERGGSAAFHDVVASLQESPITGDELRAEAGPRHASLPMTLILQAGRRSDAQKAEVGLKETLNGRKTDELVGWLNQHFFVDHIGHLVDIHDKPDSIGLENGQPELVAAVEADPKPAVAEPKTETISNAEIIQALKEGVDENFRRKFRLLPAEEQLEVRYNTQSLKFALLAQALGLSH